MAEAGFFGDTLVLMRSGHIVQQGNLKNLIDTPAEPFEEQLSKAQRGPMETLSKAKS